jgi:regulator of sigma D
MVQREKPKQEEHDKVIDALSTQYKKVYPKVYTNPNGEKNTSIKEHPDIYPDVLVANEENTLQFIEEVETEDSVTEAHAKEQWIPYSNVRTTFYPRVPFGSQDDARKILARLKISATVRCYSLIQNQVTLMQC